MRVKTNDGHLYIAADPAELVAMMHEDSFSPCEDDTTWMKETAERSISQSNMPVRFDTADHFVTDLLLAGLLKEVEDEQAPSP